MSSDEWHDWRAYMALEPTVADILPIIGAQIAQAIWNVQIAKGKSTKNPNPQMASITEFILRFGDMPDPKQREATSGPARDKATGQRRFDRLVEELQARTPAKKKKA